ncbi:hypothetical protein GXP67_20150 [Rhodocytophaga rosea]|uniref:Uncharacterized protein n=1 Tax=Rhodocytophaga rosea TaxID=2704465 RepID=A0A6C0GLI2_9BACT|nr:hypothetical protein [Rhodocytophaga rosea]QHT68797.1 hypothetical protein GXP67_20150 [Rhodocytophaga rosea]
MKRTLFFLFILLLAITWSCQTESDFSSSPPQPEFSSTQEVSSRSQQTISSQMLNNVAVDVINLNFGQEFYPITLTQIKGVSQQQFTQWLQSSAIASAHQGLLPVLANTATEYIIISNVTVRATGKQTTVAMIGVPSQLTGQYAEAIILEEKSNIPASMQLKICIWKKCTPYAKCVTRIRPFPANVACPTDQCNVNNPCVMYAVPPGTTIGLASLRSAIAAF